MKENQTVLRKNPVVRTGKWAVSLMKNKLVASLMLLAQGILFIVTPQGDMKSLVQIASVIVIVACVINILLHLAQKNKSFITGLLMLLNVLFIAVAIYCLISPQTVEPYVRIIFGVITVLSGLINLAETLKIEKRNSWQRAVGIIAALFMIGLGVAMMIASTARIEMVQQSSGIFLILSSLLNIWYVIRLKLADKPM
ncbi:MAG: DUF308 domain-containing protein [Clostridia bacterium]|nr:DUF308 domain-containing protein [Clostridia bacterium]